MMKFYSTFPYLTLIIAQFLVFVLCFLAANKHRWPMFLSALLSAPFGFFSVFFVPAYWQPLRIGEWVGTGIEDIIFSFANGGIVWFMVTWPLRKRLSVDIQVKRVLKRYLLLFIPGISFFLIILFMGFDPMTAVLLGMVVMSSIIILLRCQLWLLSVVGAVCFGVLYTIICHIIFTLDPDFLMQWNLNALSGYFFLGVPLEEIAWSIGFGATWPLFVAYPFNTRIEPPKTSYEKKQFFTS